MKLSSEQPFQGVDSASGAGIIDVVVNGGPATLEMQWSGGWKAVPDGVLTDTVVALRMPVNAVGRFTFASGNVEIFK